MAVTAFASGTQSATVTTEHSLASVNAAGVYVMAVDRVNMVAGDVLELRAKSIAVTGGTKRGTLFAIFYGAPPADDTMAVSLPLATDLAETDGIEWTLKQTFGTSRNFPWVVRKIA
jgi:hypothetical protein